MPPMVKYPHSKKENFPYTQRSPFFLLLFFKWEWGAHLLFLFQEHAPASAPSPEKGGSSFLAPEK